MKHVLGELGESIVKDGEGARHLVRIEVTNAPSEAAAHNVAQAIATSTLVQTALHGQDANWGRILSAAGNAGVAFDPAKIGLKFGHVTLVKKGIGLGPAAEQDAKRVMAQDAYTIGVDLDMGSASAHYLTCDIGHAYVDVNASYRS
jgi:glutamate N-acetyltransferase/amino-acid N-acetyltransferase